MITGPAEYRIAGNGPAAPYTNVGLGIQENEFFPIVIPDATLISYWDAYIVTQQNFYDIPTFSAFSLFGQAAGLIFPADTTLVDRGRMPTVATEATDNRGPGNPRPLPPLLLFDVGSFETQ